MKTTIQFVRLVLGLRHRLPKYLRFPVYVILTLLLAFHLGFDVFVKLLEALSVTGSA